MSERDQYPPAEPEGTQPRVHEPGPPRQRIVGTRMGAETESGEVHGGTETGEDERQANNG